MYNWFIVSNFDTQSYPRPCRVVSRIGKLIFQFGKINGERHRENAYRFTGRNDIFNTQTLLHV